MRLTLTAVAADTPRKNVGFSDVDEREALRFERRRLPRKKFNQGAMAVLPGDESAGAIVRATILDASHTGMKVRLGVPVEAGTEFSVRPDSPMWPAQRARAVRCAAQHDDAGAVTGYDVGVLLLRRRLSAA